MNALEAFGQHCLHAKQVRAFGSPVTAGACAVFLAGDHHQWRALLLVAHGSVVDRELLAAWHVHGIAAFFACKHFVANADIGERPAHHDFVVAAP